MFWSYVYVFLYGEIGERVSIGFSEIGIAIDELDWYLVPVEMWKMLLPLKLIAHKSFGFCGFGRASCAREIFKMVWNFNVLWSFHMKWQFNGIYKKRIFSWFDFLFQGY